MAQQPPELHRPGRGVGLSRPALSLAILLAAVALAVTLLSPFYVSLLAFTGLFALAAMGMVILLQAGQVSLGQAAFMGLGAYVTAVLTRDYGLSGWLGIGAGLGGTALVALVIGAVTLRLRGHYLPLATLAWGISLSVIFVAWIEVTGGSSGLDNIPPLAAFGRPIASDRVFTCLIWSIVAAIVVSLHHFQGTRMGRAARAVRANELMAATFGIDPLRLKIRVFILSAVLAGLAGALYAHLLRFISPSPFSLGASFKILIMAVLGGPAHPAGGIVGAVFLEGLEYSLQGVLHSMLGVSGNYEIVVFGALLVLLLLKWPQGLWPLVARILRAPPREIPRAAQPLPEQARATVDGPMLSVNLLSKQFGGLQALRDFNLTVRTGEILGLIGPNGAGKTTAFNVIAGVFGQTSGSIEFRGAGLEGGIASRADLGMARTFQHVQLVGEMSVIENVALGCYARTRSAMLSCLTGLDAAEERRALRTAYGALQRVGLTGRAHDEAGSLPLGQQRLVEVARALAADPVLLLLDEPAASLRHGEKVRLAELIRQLRGEGITIVLIEHDMDLLMSIVDRVVVLNRGQLLAEGSPAQIQSDPAVIEAYLGSGR
ncbi:MAG: branched-chain amino acid ABC transporter ATP-binding protein/permease [Burkholderiales bacterium]|nr:branched-chain amino acid ABC transporter ATP-binding protein/permease [Burkholderiales bacterium]